MSASSSGSAGPLLSERVQRVSLVNDVAERIRQAVIAGDLQPGDEINEYQLSERLGVARNTLREAIRILVGEGLLEKLPSRSARVQMLTREKAWEIMTARAVIESYAAGLLASRMDPQKSERLRSLWEELHLAATDADHGRFVHCDFELHRAVMEMAGHELLFQTWIRLSAWIRLMFASQRYSEQQMLANAADHHAIVSAIIERDPARAEMHMKQDLLNQDAIGRFASSAVALIAEGGIRARNRIR